MRIGDKYKTKSGKKIVTILDKHRCLSDGKVIVHYTLGGQRSPQWARYYADFLKHYSLHKKASI